MDSGPRNGFPLRRRCVAMTLTKPSNGTAQIIRHLRLRRCLNGDLLLYQVLKKVVRISKRTTVQSSPRPVRHPKPRTTCVRFPKFSEKRRHKRLDYRRLPAAVFFCERRKGPSPPSLIPSGSGIMLERLFADCRAGKVGVV